MLNQKEVSFEIIICDDGSIENLFLEIEILFRRYLFRNYFLIGHDSNQGAVNNIIDGAKIAKGRYIKMISPGDFLYDDATLRIFSDYINKHPADAYLLHSE